jgi:hypothetical protein
LLTLDEGTLELKIDFSKPPFLEAENSFLKRDGVSPFESKTFAIEDCLVLEPVAGIEPPPYLF